MTTPPEVTAATLTEARNLVTDGILEAPAGQPIPVESFADAVALAEAPGHGTKPLLVFDGSAPEAAIGAQSARRQPTRRDVITVG